jgi:hypothetical protein
MYAEGKYWMYGTPLNQAQAGVDVLYSLGVNSPSQYAGFMS